MPTFTSPPILVWQPGGGVPGGPISNPPVYSQHDVTPLVQGQAYVDVVFGSVQTTEDWVLVECNVVNELDLAPLNIWPGIITDRTTAGFRLQLNGLPDSTNYYLHWAVSGVNILPTPASLYLFTGPTSGIFGVDKTFTVKLPPSTTLASPITVTPDDGGAGGTFAPTSVVLSSAAGTATFTYTAATYGAVTLSVTNSGTLLDPASIVFTSIPPLYTFSGPTDGVSGVASTNFTVQVAGEATLVAPTTVTPHATGGGTFTPTTVLLTVGGVPVHFTYTPSSAGAKTISVTNDGGLVDPASLIYTVAAGFMPTDIAGCKGWWKADGITAPGLIFRRPDQQPVGSEPGIEPFTIVDGDVVNTWPDASGNGKDMTAGGAYSPTYKTSILNGNPVLRFNGSSNAFAMPTLGLTTQPNTWFLVLKETSKPSQCIPFWNIPGQIIYFDTAGHINIYAGASLVDAVDNSGAFHVLSIIFTGGNGTLYVDGTLRLGPGAVGSQPFNPSGGVFFMAQGGSGPFYPGDVAEVVSYDTALGTTDRTNVETYLRVKYGL